MTAPAGADACRWCGKGFIRHRHGSPQSFCAGACRNAFHTAARRAAERMLAAGRLTIVDLGEAAAEACTLPECGKKPAPRPVVGLVDPELLAALRRRGRMRLAIVIEPEGIAGLVAMSWLDGRCCGDPAAVANAVVEISDAALAAGLRPR